MPPALTITAAYRAARELELEIRALSGVIARIEASGRIGTHPACRGFALQDETKHALALARDALELERATLRQRLRDELATVEVEDRAILSAKHRFEAQEARRLAWRSGNLTG